MVVHETEEQHQVFSPSACYAAALERIGISELSLLSGPPKLPNTVAHIPLCFGIEAILLGTLEVQVFHVTCTKIIIFRLKSCWTTIISKSQGI